MKRQKLTLSSTDLPTVLFEDRFIIRSVDNSKFEKVGRIRGKSSGFDAEIILDINVDIYPVYEKEVRLRGRARSQNVWHVKDHFNVNVFLAIPTSWLPLLSSNLIVTMF